MRAFGADRVRAGKGEQWILFSPRPKNWQACVPKTLTTAEHPGTAILWEERFFEVVSAERSGTGVRYVLEPWRDHHVIRVSDLYDDASEQQREADHHATIARERGRKTANFAGIFTGLLPASAQEQLRTELGLLPAKLTSLSLLLPFAYVVWFVLRFVQDLFDHQATPFALLLLAIYLLFETIIRLYFAWFQRRPIGSILGVVPYVIFYVAAGKRTGAVSPFEVPRGQRVFITEPTDDVALRDAYNMREPFLTLLSAGEQQALSKRFGFDYRKHGRVVAWVILFGAAAGVASSVGKLQAGPRLSAFVSLIVALGIGIEQLVRLVAMRRGPVPSVFGVFVRPFARKLLQAE